jgi:hypothetical protein
MDEETTPSHRDPGLFIIAIVGLAVASASAVAGPGEPPVKIVEKSEPLEKAGDGASLVAANRTLSLGLTTRNGPRARNNG